MPFIGTQLNQFTIPPIELILDRLQIVSCDDIVTLHGQIPHELVGNRYQWYQISGLIIEWLTPTNELTVMFRQTLVKDDKVFRLMVNQGTASQVQADILVTAIPRDDAPVISHSPHFYTQAFRGKAYSDSEVATAIMIPGLSPSGSSVNNPLRGVMFNIPIVPQLPDGYINPNLNMVMVSYMTAVDVTGGIEVPLDTIPYYTKGYFNVASHKSVRIDTVVVRDKISHTAKGIPAGFFPPPKWLDMDTFDPCTVSLSGCGALRQTFTTTDYTIIPILAEDTLTVVAQYSKFYQTSLTYPLSLNSTCPISSDPLNMSLLDTKLYLTYTRLDLGVGGLG